MYRYKPKLFSYWACYSTQTFLDNFGLESVMVTIGAISELDIQVVKLDIEDNILPSSKKNQSRD
jgi:hypothetical protein